MTRITIGCDPGQTGAIAAIYWGEVVALHDMPVSARQHGKGQQVDGYELSSILLAIRAEQLKPLEMYLEAVASRPLQSSQSGFNFGESVGVVLGVCGALQIPVRWVTPQTWKKHAGLIKKDKDVARTLAIQHHPNMADMLNLKKHIGRADAILIAEYGASKGR